MRVGNKTVFDSVTNILGINTTALSKAYDVTSSGKRLIDLATDPVALPQAMSLKSTLANMTQMGRGITLGQSWLSAGETALSTIQGLVSDAKSLAVQMSSATTSPSSRTFVATDIQNKLEEIVSLANTEMNGRYVFSGSKTEIAPFTLEADNTVTYNGDSSPFIVKIGRNASVEIGSDGSEVFQSSTSNIFETLNDLKRALAANDVPGIQNAIDVLGDDIDFLAGKISDLGTKNARMDAKSKIYQDLKLSNTDRLSQIEDADMASAIMELKSKEVAYQAALTAASKILNMSLMDYM